MSAIHAPMFSGQLSFNLPSILAAAIADGYVTKAAPEYDITETGESTWSDNFTEFGSSAVLSYVHTPSSVVTTGTLSTKTLNIDITKSYFINCANTSATNDLSNIDLEFLDSSNSVVCAVRNIDSSHDYASDLFYGSSLSSLTQTGQAYGTFNNQVTKGNISFTPTALVFTNTATGAFNTSFSFNCSANTITKVRISNVIATSNSTGGSGIAHVILQKTI